MTRKWKAKPKLNKWETAVKRVLTSAGFHPQSQVSPFADSLHRFDFRLVKQKVFVEVDGGFHKKRVNAAWTDAHKTFKATQLGWKVIRIRVPDQDNAATQADFEMRAMNLAKDLTTQTTRYYY